MKIFDRQGTLGNTSFQIPDHSLLSLSAGKRKKIAEEAEKGAPYPQYLSIRIDRRV